MRITIGLAALLLTGCANDLSTSQSAYNTCLSERPAIQCQNERARLDAALQTQAVRNTTPPLVLQRWNPPAPIPIQPRQTYCYPAGGGQFNCNSY